MKAQRARALSVSVAVALVLGAGGACAPDPSTPPCASCAPPALPAGTTPNDVALSRCDGRPVALVADSGEARLHTIALDDGALWASTVFESDRSPDGDRAASPWAVAVTPDGARAAVTLFGQDRVAWVDPCAGRVLSMATLPGAVTPQPTLVVGNRVIVAFTNVRAFSFNGEPPLLDAGTLAAFSVSDDTLTLDRSITLPCTNPQGLAAVGLELIVSCSGPLARGPDGGQAAIDDGAVLRVDAPTLVVRHVHPAARLAPGTATRAGGVLVAGSLVDPSLLATDIIGPDGEDGPLAIRQTLEGNPVDALFEAARWGDAAVLVTRFTTDTLLVVDARDGLQIRDNIEVGPGGDAFRGLLAVDVRPDFAPDDEGSSAIDGVALLALSAELVPLRLTGRIGAAVDEDATENQDAGCSRGSQDGDPP